MTFSPDSRYATWSVEERIAAGRAEERFNGDARCRLAEGIGRNYVRVATDDSLLSLLRTYRRQLEDVESGDPCGDERAALARAKLAEIEREQQARAALAQSWLAADNGTHCYPSYAARGGLAAVAHHGAPKPSYQLAAKLDRLNWLRGLPHVLTWQERADQPSPRPAEVSGGGRR